MMTTFVLHRSVYALRQQTEVKLLLTGGEKPSWYQWWPLIKRLQTVKSHSPHAPITDSAQINELTKVHQTVN